MRPSEARNRFTGGPASDAVPRDRGSGSRATSSVLPSRPADGGRMTDDGHRIEERIDLRGRSLRQHAARGTVVNSAFQVGLAGLGLLRRVVIAAFLTRSEFGIWGILITTLMTLAWLKEVGVADKYIQQDE